MSSPTQAGYDAQVLNAQVRPHSNSPPPGEAGYDQRGPMSPQGSPMYSPQGSPMRPATPQGPPGWPSPPTDTRSPFGLDPGGPQPRTPRQTEDHFAGQTPRTNDPGWGAPPSDIYIPPTQGGPRMGDQRGMQQGPPADWQYAMQPVQGAGGVSGYNGPGGYPDNRGPPPSFQPGYPDNRGPPPSMGQRGPGAAYKPPAAGKKGGTGLPRWYPQYLVGIVEIVKIIDFLTELMKVLCGKDAAGDYFPWAIFTLVMASWLMLHRAFDQVALMVLATGWAGEYLCVLMCSTCPCACVFFPLANLTFCLYRQEHPNAVTDERAIFAQRPISTVMLGLPFSGVMSMFFGPAELVMHPAQVHIRSMQAMFQTIFLNIPDFIVDLVVILNAEEDTEGVGWFYVSLFYSIIELATVCLMTVVHIHEAEKKKPVPPRQNNYRY